jgi:hypothetical protein
MDGETISHKMSYARLYEPYDWIIATGIYLNDVDQLVNNEKNMTEYTEKILSEKKKTERALEEVKKLKGLFPICSQCKKIRDDQGYWNQIE